MSSLIMSEAEVQARYIRELTDLRNLHCWERSYQKVYPDLTQTCRIINRDWEKNKWGDEPEDIPYARNLGVLYRFLDTAHIPYSYRLQYTYEGHVRETDKHGRPILLTTTDSYSIGQPNEDVFYDHDLEEWEAFTRTDIVIKCPGPIYLRICHSGHMDNIPYCYAEARPAAAMYLALPELRQHTEEQLGWNGLYCNTDSCENLTEGQLNIEWMEYPVNDTDEAGATALYNSYKHLLLPAYYNML